MRKEILILLHYTVHMVLNLLKCSRNYKIYLFIFKQLFKNFFKICLCFCLIKMINKIKKLFLADNKCNAKSIKFRKFFRTFKGFQS